MKDKVRSLVSNPLFSGSVIMIIGSNFSNSINYFYHLTMGRLLGPASYGELATLISLMGLLGTVPSALGPVIIKFISSSKNYDDTRSLLVWLNKKVFYLSLILLAVFILLSPLLSAFLHINNYFYIIIIAFASFFALLELFYRSTLHGLLRFKETVVALAGENAIKLIAGVILVFLGLKVFGALIGILISVVISLGIVRFFIRDYLKDTVKKKHSIKSLLAYAFPILVYMASFTSFYSMDLVLVKHFLSAHDAGIYAALSVLGRIVMFGVSPITSVMFPIVSRRHAKGERYIGVFLYSLSAALAISVLIIGIFSLFPTLTITLIYGTQYIEASNLLVFYGITMTILTMSYLVVNFYLALGVTWVVVLPFIASIIQAVGIIIHHQSLESVISVTLGSMLFLAISLTILLISRNLGIFNNKFIAKA